MPNRERLKYSLEGEIPTTANARYYEYQEICYDYKAIGDFPVPVRRGIERFLPLLPVAEIPSCFTRGG